MSIAEEDFEFRLSGGAANSNPNAALGGAKSSELTSSDVDMLFDSATAAEALAGRVEYRCEYLHNGHATETMVAACVWVESNTPLSGTALAIGVGTSAVNGTEQAVANETTAPDDVVFSAPADAANAIALGNIPPGQHRAIWLRRTVNAGSGKSPEDGWELRVRCETT